MLNLFNLGAQNSVKAKNGEQKNFRVSNFMQKITPSKAFIKNNKKMLVGIKNVFFTIQKLLKRIKFNYVIKQSS